MRYWEFNENTGKFERSSVQAILFANVAITNDESEIKIFKHGEPTKIWRGDEPLIVAGVAFEREMFE